MNSNKMSIIEDLCAYFKSALIIDETLKLPHELIEYIFLCLPLSSIINMRQVSKLWSKISCSDHIWRHHLHITFRNKIKPNHHELLFKKYYEDSRGLDPKSLIRWGIKAKCTVFVLNLYKRYSHEQLQWTSRERNSSLIYLAAVRGLTEIIKFFLDFDIYKADEILEGDSSPLYVACQENHVDTVKVLVKYGANTEFKFREGFSPLYVACQRGNVKVVEFLISAGADVNSQCIHGSTPLYIAAQEGRTNVIDLLLKASAIKSLTFRRGFTPLYVASRNGHYEAAKRLIEDDDNLNARDGDGSCPVYVAAQNNHHSVLKLLLDSGAHPDFYFLGGYSPLYVASQNGHDKCVEELCKTNRVNINKRAPNGSAPLYIACQNGYFKVVEILLNYGADINLTSSEFCPLYISIHKGYNDIINILLSRSDINVNFISDAQPSIFYAAYKNERLDIVELLISKGAVVENNLLYAAIEEDFNVNIIVQLMKKFSYMLFEGQITPCELIYKSNNTILKTALTNFLKENYSSGNIR
jgi:ankyrin repeat protein